MTEPYVAEAGTSAVRDFPVAADPGVRPVRSYGDPVLPLATSRLRFREMTDTDLQDIATLDIGGSRGPAGWITWNRRNYEEHGFGLWIVETHAGRFVGDCGLTLQEVEGTWFVEAGWHVRSDLRGQGYATEAAEAVREAARLAGIDHLIAIIRPDNMPSQRVASRIGLVLGRQVTKSGRPALVFGADLQR
jgi:RimJ/RimL family protein N-acetyltransferase